MGDLNFYSKLPPIGKSLESENNHQMPIEDVSGLGIDIDDIGISCHTERTSVAEHSVIDDENIRTTSTPKHSSEQKLNIPEITFRNNNTTDSNYGEILNNPEDAARSIDDLHTEVERDCSPGSLGTGDVIISENQTVESNLKLDLTNDDNHKLLESYPEFHTGVSKNSSSNTDNKVSNATDLPYYAECAKDVCKSSQGIIVDQIGDNGNNQNPLSNATDLPYAECAKDVCKAATTDNNVSESSQGITVDQIDDNRNNQNPLSNATDLLDAESAKDVCKDANTDNNVSEFLKSITVDQIDDNGNNQNPLLNATDLLDAESAKDVCKDANTDNNVSEFSRSITVDQINDADDDEEDDSDIYKNVQYDDDDDDDISLLTPSEIDEQKKWDKEFERRVMELNLEKDKIESRKVYYKDKMTDLIDRWNGLEYRLENRHVERRQDLYRQLQKILNDNKRK